MKFPRPLHLKRDGESTDVIVFGKDPTQAEQDLLNGIARVGGFGREPNYGAAYILSAQILVREACLSQRIDDLGMPIFYLQRHATELMLKSLIYFLHEIAKLREALGEGINPITEKAKHNLGHKHNLETLYRDLIDAAVALALQPPPRELGALVDEMKIELTETWSRYSFSNKVHHTRDEHVIPITALQASLDEANRLCASSDNDSYIRYLNSEWSAYFERIENFNL